MLIAVQMNRGPRVCLIEVRGTEDEAKAKMAAYCIAWLGEDNPANADPDMLPDAERLDEYTDVVVVSATLDVPD